MSLANGGGGGGLVLPLFLSGTVLLLLVVLGVIAFALVLGFVFFLFPVVLMMVGLYLAIAREQMTMGAIVFGVGLVLFVVL